MGGIDSEIGDFQEGSEGVSSLLERLGATFHAVDNRDHAVDFDSRLLEPVDRLERAAPGRDDVLDDDDAVPYTTVPFGIVVTPNAVITVCARQTALIDEFRLARRSCPPYDRHRFAFNIMLKAATLFLRYLREIGDDADRIERNLHLHQALKNDSLIDLRDLQKALVYFTTSLTSDEIVVSRLGHMRQLGINEDDLDFLDDVAIEYSQALEMSTIHANILTGTMDSFASVISNNLNVVMKSLTAVTIVFMLPTLISSIYGMNVHLPLQAVSPPESQSLVAFFVIMGISFVLALGTVFFFIRRKLF